jgi:hypothetical protein
MKKLSVRTLETVRTTATVGQYYARQNVPGMY